jgi:two-component system phosphate regulon sensor histidine kinase PhoR
MPDSDPIPPTPPPPPPHPDPTRDLLPAFDEVQAKLDSLTRDTKAAERAELAGILAAAVAHEISNILTPVQSSAEMALENLADQEYVKRSLLRIVAGTRRAGVVVEAILECAGGSGCSTWNTCDVAAAAANAVALLGEQSLGPTIRLEQRIEPGCRAAMSQVCLEQVLMNLLLNAAASMGRRGGRVQVRGCSTWNTLSGPRVVIEVEDEGRGIEPGRVGSIFEPFVSGRGDGRRGRGLGLTICKHLVEAARGTIEIRSTSSAGTVFVVELPAAVAGEGQAAA